MDSEATLLERARGGDGSALEALLARHERQVFRFGLRMCGNEEEAREVLQETLLAAFRNLHSFRGEARLSTWLYQIARSACLRGRRRGVDEPEALEPLDQPAAAAVPADEAGPEAVAHARELGAILREEISALPEAWREVVVLRDVEGVPAEEAASILGVEVGALKSRLHRARTELRARVSRRMGEGDAVQPCPELARELELYASESIDRSACAQLEQHLKGCPRCGGAFRALEQTATLCRQVSTEEVPPEVQAAVREAVRAVLPTLLRAPASG